MCAGYFLVLLDVTIVNVALPRIASGLRGGVSSLQWVVDAYALSLASLMLAGGTIGDISGHRRVVLRGLGVFGLGSLGCGLAPSTGLLVGFRVLQGAGAALLLPGTLAIISHAFPEPRAGARAIGMWAGIGSLALPAGPLLGGLLISAWGWRAIFLVNLPVVAVSLLATLALVPESRGNRAAELDRAGVLLGMLVLLSATFTVIQAGRSGVTPAVLVGAAAAAGLAAAFVYVERRRGGDAMLPLGLFQRPAFSAANGLAAVMNLGTLGALFILTLYLQGLQGRSPLTAGLALIPLFAPLAIIAPLAGRVTSRIGSRLPSAFGLGVAAAGIGLLVGAGPATPYPFLLVAFLLWGTGLGVLTPAVVAAAIAAVPGQRAGLASAINNTARQAGGAIGVAVAGAVAGGPVRQGSFLSGFHTVVGAAAIMYAAAALCALALIPGRGAARS